MPTFNPRLFTKADRLKNISAANLVALFSPWSEYLAGRGVELIDDEDEFPFDRLSSVLMTPTDETPTELVDALYFIHESASDLRIEDLLNMARTNGLDLAHSDDATPADVAVQIWLLRPDLLRDSHNRAVVFNQKKFEYFSGRTAEPQPFPEVSEGQTLEIQATFDEWFSSKRKGRGTRFLTFRRDHRVWMLVRHGLPMRREGKHQDSGETATELYRPQQHDVLVYDENSGEIGVHTSTKGETDLYLHTLGFVLFNDPDHFGKGAKYNFDPLLNHGPDALACDDIEGIDRVVLVEVQKYWGGFAEREIRKADDIFAAFADKWPERLRSGKITSVGFKVRFANSSKDRSVTIRLPNIARYDRDDDSDLIEQWLAARGFCSAGDE
ncbi:hypothetical protein FHS51_003448 [Sphingobium wenxiniae]|uniref:Uncharacterized protein n=1 Tax=Sphingobium wenxiniae (strain DSM 21828 / CGMCC 1.7748 / JZ-1) TaxID=595605 RepID=A0A562KMV9_SPHWJ|nr:hypothetical protein [Sphingobium wenxiniae]MBB6193192.1 hypothetical protein [Sphingobium wenxiniae]TWH96749.1 hypothetical protein IQ35_00680 [Sphingobium wenxiniae]